jgi:hypothetical protein
MSNLGGFSDEALLKYSLLASEKLPQDFSEGGTYDFTRCVRPDGSAYGTGGRCRKGTEEAKEEKKSEGKKLTDKKIKALREASRQRAKAKVLMAANENNPVVRGAARTVFNLYNKLISRAERKYGLSVIEMKLGQEAE